MPRYAVALALAFVAMAARATAATPTVKFAQTHVFEAPYKRWTAGQTGGQNLKSPYDETELHLIGARPALVLVEFYDAGVSEAKMRVTNAFDATGTDLTLDASTPGTYGDDDATTMADGGPYSSTAYSAIVPGEYVKRGLSVEITWTSGGSPRTHAMTSIKVGAPTRFKIVTVPVYFFNASESMVHNGNVLTAERVGNMEPSVAREYSSKMPCSTFHTELHPMKRFNMSYVVVPPGRAYDGVTRAAYRINQRDDEANGFDTISIGMGILRKLRKFDGESDVATQYYSPLIYKKSARKGGGYDGPGGGLGGGHIGTGSYTFSGVFFHEQGHAAGLPHALDGYNSQSYPYVKGSLQGSAWAYDMHSNKLIDPYKKPCTYNTCPSNGYKQDVMQGGHGDQEDGQYFGLFSDYNAARIQHYFEGRGAIGVTPAGGFAKWDGDAQAWSDATSSVKVVTINEPVVFIYATASCTELSCDSGGALDTSKLWLTQIYPPVAYVGNSTEVVDVDDRAQFERFNYDQATGDEREYCGRGCDFMYKVHFADGTHRTVMIPDGASFRSSPASSISSDATNPLHGDSFISLGCVVRTEGKDVVRVDMLYLPFVWRGVHNRAAQLITSWTKTGGETRPISPVNTVGQPVSTLVASLKMLLPAGKGICSYNVTSAHARQVEELAMSALEGFFQKQVSAPIPPLSGVALTCACAGAGATCDATCKKQVGFRSWELPPSSLSRSSEVQCGCQFKCEDLSGKCQYGFEPASDKCERGTHASKLTKRWHSSQVYYYVDAYDRPLMEIEGAKDMIDDFRYDKTLDKQINKCRKDPECQRIIFEQQHSRYKTSFKRGICANPCYVKDYWNRVTYIIDMENPWELDITEREALVSAGTTVHLDVKLASSDSTLLSQMQSYVSDTCASVLLAMRNAFPWPADTPSTTSCTCDASTPPTNGAVGDCTDSLASGSTCQPTCNAGYTASGPSSCTAGTLASATCGPIWSLSDSPGLIFTSSARDASRGARTGVAIAVGSAVVLAGPFFN